MALTRARVVVGPPVLRKRISQVIQTAIQREDDPVRIRGNAAAMRARMERDLPPHGPWDVKLRPGGQIEVEFIAQVLQLVHAAANPEICSPTTGVALRRLRDAKLLQQEDAEVLIRADRLWRTIQGMLRLTVGQVSSASLPAAPGKLLLAAVERIGVQAADQADLLRGMDEIARQVRAVFVRHVGELVL